MGRKYEPNTNPEKSRKIGIHVSSNVDKMTSELLIFHGVSISELYEGMVVHAHSKMSRTKKVTLAKRKAELLKQIAAIEEALKG